MNKNTKRIYNTRKRKAKAMLNKAIIIILAIAIGNAVIAYAGENIETYEPAGVIIPRKEISEEVKLSNKEKVIKICEKRNFNQTERLLKVIDCESKFDQYAINVNKGGSVDRGIAQWNDYFHSNMTNEQAFDLDYSINKMIDYWNDGKQGLWACYSLTQ
jgi:hypothetical protein